MNVLLLDKTAFDEEKKTAFIGNPMQIAHVKTILKAGVGDTLKIGKLGGCIGSGRIVQSEPQGYYLAEVVLDEPPPAKLGITLVLALPRPKVLRRLIMDMTALGVDRLVLVNSVRTDKSYWGSPLLARLDEFVQEGLQQGVDTIAPDIVFAKRFKPFVQDELPTYCTNQKAVVLHPYADMPLLSIDERPQVVIIGAEGGFVPYEIELLASVGVQSVTLGRRILRTESAVNAVLGRWL